LWVTALQYPHVNPAALSLSAITSQYFIAAIMTDSSRNSQGSVTIIEIRPYKRGWQCFEGTAVGPYWIGEKAKEDATHYAMTRAKFARGEIHVLNADGSLEGSIPF
jgi:hypothetical protein